MVDVYQSDDMKERTSFPEPIRDNVSSKRYRSVAGSRTTSLEHTSALMIPQSVFLKVTKNV